MSRGVREHEDHPYGAFAGVERDAAAAGQRVPAGQQDETRGGDDVESRATSRQSTSGQAPATAAATTTAGHVRVRGRALLRGRAEPARPPPPAAAIRAEDPKAFANKVLEAARPAAELAPKSLAPAYDAAIEGCRIQSRPRVIRPRWRRIWTRQEIHTLLDLDTSAWGTAPDVTAQDFHFEGIPEDARRPVSTISSSPTRAPSSTCWS